jgi:RNA polymerase sigma factor (sigma-70 family)
MAADTDVASVAAGTSTAPLEAEETRSHVQRVLDELPDRQRIVLEWKYLDSLRVREIAERLGDSEKAVETVLYRARREFRRLFERPCATASSVRTDLQGTDIPQQSQS